MIRSGAIKLSAIQLASATEQRCSRDWANCGQRRSASGWQPSDSACPTPRVLRGLDGETEGIDHTFEGVEFSTPGCGGELPIDFPCENSCGSSERIV